MNIDSHQHFWKYNPVRDQWITDDMAVLRRDYLPAELAEHLSDNSLDGCIAVQADQSENETLFLLDLAYKNEWILGVVGWIDLQSPRLADQLNFYKEFDRLAGFRHILQAEPKGFMLQPDFVRGLKTILEADYTYDVLIHEDQLEETVLLVNQLPSESKLVIDHLGKPNIKNKSFANWEKYIKTLSLQKNIHIKLSGMVTEADWTHWTAQDFNPYMDAIFEYFGIDRVMFGSDWPVSCLAADYNRVVELVSDYTSSFTKDQKAQIMGGNALRFYNLNSN